jgi:hypothetical protein
MSVFVIFSQIYDFFDSFCDTFKKYSLCMSRTAYAIVKVPDVIF